MNFLIILLKKEELVDKIMSILVELGIINASIFEGESIESFLAHEVPIFAGLRQLLGENKQVSKTIMALLKNKEDFAEVKRLFAEEGLDFTQSGLGAMVTLPIGEGVFSEE